MGIRSFQTPTIFTLRASASSTEPSTRQPRRKVFAVRTFGRPARHFSSEWEVVNPLRPFRCPLCYMYFMVGSHVVCSRLVVRIVQELVQHPARAFQIIIANLPACDLADFYHWALKTQDQTSLEGLPPQAPSVIVGPNKTNRNNPKHDSNHHKKPQH